MMTCEYMLPTPKAPDSSPVSAEIEAGGPVWKEIDEHESRHPAIGGGDAKRVVGTGAQSHQHEVLPPRRPYQGVDGVPSFTDNALGHGEPVQPRATVANA